MSDVWYCMEGTAAKGPMAFAELAAIVSAAPDRRAVPVWRHARGRALGIRFFIQARGPR